MIGGGAVLRTVAVLLALIWCGIATYQIWRDWHEQLLPFGASGLAAGAGILWLLSGSSWAEWGNMLLVHAVTGAVIGLISGVWWWVGKLGLGDVVSMVVFGAVFGGIPAFVVISVGYLVTGIGIGVRRIAIGPWPADTDASLGPGLWSAAVVMWGVLWGMGMR